MKIIETERNTFEITWEQGKVEINLIPANRFLPTSSSCRPAFNGELITVHDNVGIISLQLNNCSPVPRVCWDNREHHFWRGFNGGFRPRNTIVNDITIKQSEDKNLVSVSYFHVVDFVKTTMTWIFKEPENGALAQWDTNFTFENLNKFDLVDYMALFACYHKPGRNYFWDAKNELSECADSFRAYPTDKKKSREEEIVAPFREQVKGWTGPCQNPTKASVLYGRPILTSDKYEWFNNGRHVLFIEPEKCLTIVSAMTQARDYMLAPAQKDLSSQGSFTARVRHIIANINDTEDLNSHWNTFIQDIQ